MASHRAGPLGRSRRSVPSLTYEGSGRLLPPSHGQSQLPWAHVSTEKVTSGSSSTVQQGALLKRGRAWGAWAAWAAWVQVPRACLSLD